ncbi:GerMN domain-containing protein [Ornithinibacillus halophilus]|uniref:Germination protein M n=1 Tax=Ornithinibacillus halophilus TaxID=930117 RepID=A0A1M5NAK2_9BACI|nr:GerMN domain-containing protein [Ornithinibacillus halophilus]SHG86540.1 germination protein M [Ornithinibacillus halophilus]
MRIRRLLFLLITVSIALILTGCFGSDEQSQQEEMDPPPPNAEAVDGNTGDTSSVQTDEPSTVERELYLLDSNGLVVPQTLEIPMPESKEVATQALEYLVKDGPITELLPNGFGAVLPAETEILGLDLQEDGTMIVDVSEDFASYQPEDELKILESMTWTLTQFDGVERVELWMNGHEVKAMPVNGTPVANGYSRANGINVVHSDTVDLINSKAVTMYFPTEHDDNQYFVPVTQHVENNNGDELQAVVERLIEGPGYATNVMHIFNQGTLLVDKPNLEDGVLELVFNENVLIDMENQVISDEVMESLVRTLTEQESIEAVNVRVENVDQIANESGEVYNEPVTTETLNPSEKL